METKLSVTGILLLATLLFYSCSSWHYQHPRVKTDSDGSDMEMGSIDRSKTISEIVTVQSVKIENSGAYKSDLNAEVVSTEKMVIISPVMKKETKVLSSQSTKTKMDKKGTGYYTQKVMDDHYLLKVKEVEKSTLVGWVRIMIILFVVGFIFLLMGIFFSIFLHGVWWMFSMLGSLCILAGFIILILGLVGLI